MKSWESGEKENGYSVINEVRRIEQGNQFLQVEECNQEGQCLRC